MRYILEIPHRRQAMLVTTSRVKRSTNIVYDSSGREKKLSIHYLVKQLTDTDSDIDTVYCSLFTHEIRAGIATVQ